MRKAPRNLFVSLVVAGAIAFARAAEPSSPPTLELLSLANLPIKPGEYISQFSISTWGVEILAFCKIPAGWDVGGGTDGSPGGSLHGSAGDGVAFLASPNPPQLQNLFLLRVGKISPKDVPIENGVIPRTFAGDVDIGMYGSDVQRFSDLGQNSFVLGPANGCPPITESAALRAEAQIP